MTPSLAVSLRDVRFAYAGGARVLDGASLDVAEGERLGIVGPNGAGKSTLLRLAMRALVPDGGTVELFGAPVVTLTRAEIARRVALVPQQETSAFGFTVEEVVAMGRGPHLRGFLATEGARDRDVVREAMAAVGIESFAARPVARLSGGERQLVLLARALAQEPRLLLLDEPTASLDLAHQRSIARLITRAHGDGTRTVVAVLHDLNLAARLCTRIAVLAGGRIVAQGPPADVLNDELLASVYGDGVWRATGPDGAPVVGVST